MELLTRLLGTLAGICQQKSQWEDEPEEQREVLGVMGVDD